METPKRWDAIGWKLQGALVRMVSEIAGDPYDFLTPASKGLNHLIEHLFAEELIFRPETDRAAKALSLEPQRTPAGLSSASRYFLFLRIQCGQDALAVPFPPQATSSPFADLSWSDSQAIAWLLNDVWRRRFDHWLKLTALAIHGPFPFYGLVGAKISDGE